MWKLQLLKESKVLALLCKGGNAQCLKAKVTEDDAIEGKWFTLYDQALNVELVSGIRFIANFRYNLDKANSTNINNLAQQLGKPTDYEFDEQFDSVCS